MAVVWYECFATAEKLNCFYHGGLETLLQQPVLKQGGTAHLVWGDCFRNDRLSEGGSLHVSNAE